MEEQPALRVLVVDDEAGVRSMLSSLLRVRYHAQAVLASDGEEAMALLDAGERFDWIISDYKMPKIDGGRLFHWVVTRWPEMAERFIFITGYGGDIGLADILSLHPTVPVIGKPFSAKELDALF